MAAVAAQRYFEFDFASSDKPLFATGQQWAGFARLVGHIETVLENEFGPKTGWPDLATGFHRELWRGEFDQSLAGLAWMLPSNTDSRTMQARLKEQFSGLARVLLHLAVKDSVMVAPEIAVSARSTMILDEQPADMTAVFSQATSPSEKQALVQKLNCDAKDERARALQSELLRFAAKIFRSRVVTFTSPEAAKSYMETEAGGLQARTVLVDVTMPGCRQTGLASRALCHPPTKELQRSWATAIKLIPATPVIGHVLARPALHSLEALNKKLSTTHAHKRQLTVPVAVPEEYMRYLRSGQKRALGPCDDEASGLDFIMRTIGRRFTKATPVDVDQAGEDDDAGDDEEAEDEEAEESDGQDKGDVVMAERVMSKASDDHFLAMVDPQTMSMTQLQQLFGQAAADLAGVFFQHSSRIGQAARFLPKKEALMIRSGERAIPRRYRKGQVDASAFVSAMQSALASTNVALSTNEVLVLLTGGTPEAAVAGIVCGYSKILYISDKVEQEMMTLPSEDEEKINVNYMECADP
jgi:hypothetical protein